MVLFFMHEKLLNLKNNIKRIQRVNKVLETSILPNFEDSVNNKYINNSIIYLYDDYDELKKDMNNINNSINIKEIYKESFDDYAKELIDTLKEEQNKSLKIFENIEALTKTINIYIDKYYDSISNNLERLKEVYDIEFELEERLYKTISNYFITKRITPNDDISNFMDLIGNMNDNNVNNYLKNVYDVLEREDDTPGFETGVEVFEYNVPQSYDEFVPDLNDLLQDIKKNNNLQR